MYICMYKSIYIKIHVRTYIYSSFQNSDIIILNFLALYNLSILLCEFFTYC